MKIGELLELTKSDSLAIIAKNHLSIGKEKARKALKAAGCYSINGVKGWHYDGDKAVLNQSIYDFVEGMAINEVAATVEKPRPNVPTKQVKERINNVSKEPTKKRTNVIRKRSSFDLDVQLMKELKIKAIVHDKNIYEMVETAIRKYLKELDY